MNAQMENCNKVNRDRKETLVIIPAHNEAENIQKVFDSLERDEIAAFADIVVIDDASVDGTGEVVKRRGYRLITNCRRLGYGGALQHGYRYAEEYGYSYVIQMDADGQHDSCNIAGIYRKLQEKDPDDELPDIVLASRYMEGSTPFPVSVWKRMAYALFRFLIYRITGRKIADPTTGLQGLNRRTFRYYAKDGNYHRFPDANIIIQMLLLGCRIVEIPAVMHVRTDGRSMHHGIHAAWYMLRMMGSILRVVFRIKVLKMGW